MSKHFNGRSWVNLNESRLNKEEPKTATKTDSKPIRLRGQDYEQTREKADLMLHRLWSKAAGTEDYDKEEWKELERLIWKL